MTDLATFSLDREPRGRGPEQGAMDFDMARVGLGQAGDDVDQGRRATAGPTEQRKYSSTFHFDRYVESESIAARLSANLQHQRPSILYMRRAMSSAATRPSSP